MTDPYFEHPTEEALERFLLHQSQEEELETIETHILACESCITRLESLELQVADLKHALDAFETSRIQKDLAQAKRSWKDWFTVPTLSWAGAAAVAAIALTTFVIPHTVPATFELSATRGAALVSTLPEGRPLNLRLDAGDLQPGPLKVQLVNDGGKAIWAGRTTVRNEKADVQLPRLSESGIYFLRFYSLADDASSDLLREFRFEVK